MYLQILIPIIGLVINIFFQITSFKYMRRFSLLKSEAFGFGVGLLSIFIIEFYIFSTRLNSTINWLGLLIANLIIYLAFEHAYFTFIALGETARRIRILREFYEAHCALSLEEILARYNAREIVEKRLDRLINNGQIVLRDGRYYLGNSRIVLLIARVFILLKWIVLGKKSEFD